MKRRRIKPPAASAAVAAPLPASGARRGRVSRWFSRKTTDALLAAMTSEAAVPLAMVAFGVLAAAVAIGACIGIALAGGGESW